MKKIIIYVLMTMIVLFCIGCASTPVHPKIIGTSKIQYAADDNYYYVELNGNEYMVLKIIDKQALLSGDKEIPPKESMLVTAFETSQDNHLQFMLGKKNEQEIEAAFSKNYTAFWILVLGVGWLLYQNRKKEREPTSPYE